MMRQRLVARARARARARPFEAVKKPNDGVIPSVERGIWAGASCFKTDSRWFHVAGHSNVRRQLLSADHSQSLRRSRPDIGMSGHFDSSLDARNDTIGCFHNRSE